MPKLGVRALQGASLPRTGRTPILYGMQARSIANMRIVGGHPALDLVNTVGSRRGRIGADYLATYGDLLLWAAYSGDLERPIRPIVNT